MPKKSLINRITGESYWKERAIALFMVVGLLVGNVVEMMSGKEAKDSPIIWIAGVMIGATVVVHFR
jgi:hypothetical protein